MKAGFAQLGHLLRKFRKAQDGNVAVIFAIALVPIVGLAGAAVDYSHAGSVRNAMQSALDSSALMLSKEAATLTATELKTKGTAYFNALFNKPEAQVIDIAPVYTSTGGSTLTVTGTVKVKTDFMGVMGIKELTLGSTSVVKWGTSRVRVALVLDTTGSMASDGKMDALKPAAKNLLTQLQSAATKDGDVYVSIIPFSKNVNLGATNYNADWIDWTDWESEPEILKTSKPSNWNQVGPGSNCPFSGWNNPYGFGCASEPTGTSTTTTIPSSGTYKGYICPGTDSGGANSTKIGIMYNGCYDSVPTTTVTTNTVSSGSQASCGSTQNCTCSGNGNNKQCVQTITTTGAPYTHNWIKNARSTWNGCVTDRGNSTAPASDNYDQKITAPSLGIAASKFPAEQNSYCSPDITGLSYNWTTMKAQIDALYPLGATNQPIGLVWGWQSLVGGGPLTMPAKETGYTYNEYIILMSDGLNTLDRWYGTGTSTNTTVDTRMYDASKSGAGTCANIKAAGITIYTIHVNTDSDPQSTLLKNCASSSDKFWMITSPNDLKEVFTKIGTDLSQLRIAQ